MLLETLAPAALMAKVLEVKPRPGARMSVFGWCPDGNIANSAISFAMTSLVAFVVVLNHVLPSQLIHALAHIDVVYKKHDNNQARFLSNLVETQASRFVNRSGHDPFFLAKEFARSAIGQEQVKAVVKLYRSRTLANPALAMPQRLEDAVLRLMGAKVADGTRQRAEQCTRRWGWDEGPFTVHFFLNPQFLIGSTLTDTCDAQWANMTKQTARGQELAMSIYCNDFDNLMRNQTRAATDVMAWQDLFCSQWHICKYYRRRASESYIL